MAARGVAPLLGFPRSISGGSVANPTLDIQPAFPGSSLQPDAVAFPTTGSQMQDHNLAVVMTYYGKFEGTPHALPIGSLVWIHKDAIGVVETDEFCHTFCGLAYMDWLIGTASLAARDNDDLHQRLHVISDTWRPLGVLSFVGAAPRHGVLDKAFTLGVCIADGPIDLLNIFPGEHKGAVTLGLERKFVARPPESKYFLDAAGTYKELADNGRTRVLQLVPRVLAVGEPEPSLAELTKDATMSVGGQEFVAPDWQTIGWLYTNTSVRGGRRGAHYDARIGTETFSLAVTLTEPS